MIRTDEYQISHGFMDRSAESTRVKVPIGSGNFDLVVVDTSKTISQVGSLGVEPVVVYWSAFVKQAPKVAYQKYTCSRYRQRIGPSPSR
jgi:hypothetical protein